jgi:hypothetical protein
MNAIVRNSSGRFVVVSITDSQVSSSMSARACRLTGCSGLWVSGTGRQAIESVRDDGNTQTWRTIRAIQQERERYGMAPAIRLPEYDA